MPQHRKNVYRRGFWRWHNSKLPPDWLFTDIDGIDWSIDQNTGKVNVHAIYEIKRLRVEDPTKGDRGRSINSERLTRYIAARCEAPFLLVAENGSKPEPNQFLVHPLNYPANHILMAMFSKTDVVSPDAMKKGIYVLTSDQMAQVVEHLRNKPLPPIDYNWDISPFPFQKEIPYGWLDGDMNRLI